MCIQSTYILIQNYGRQITFVDINKVWGASYLGLFNMRMVNTPVPCVQGGYKKGHIKKSEVRNMICQN